jgi:Rieske Fe-S protein
MQRSRFMRELLAAGGLVALGGAAGSLGRICAPVAAAAAPGTAAPAGTAGLWLGNARALRAGQALAYSDPASGDPALLLRLLDGRYVSFDALCTHAGCPVLYDPRRRLLACPCHGATFDPARGGAVTAGPTQIPLMPLRVHVAANGDVFALDARPGIAAPAQRLRPAPPYTGQTGDDGAGDGAGGGDDGASAIQVGGRGASTRSVRHTRLSAQGSGRRPRHTGDD